MTLTVQDLSDLTTAEIAAARAFAVQLAVEQQPNIDTKRGVIGDLIIGLDALLGAAHKKNADLLQRSQSLLEISQNTALADDDIVDAVLSNFRIARRAATTAAGEVTVVISQSIAVTIANGAVFTANGKSYSSNAAYSARTSAANVLSDTDRLLQRISDDRYAFTISVTAVDTGSTSLLLKDDVLVPQTAPTSFVTAYATSDFTGGLDQQSTADLLALVTQGIASRAYSNRISVDAMVRNGQYPQHTLYNSDFANIVAMSTVGFGDVEMQRDQHWLFPVSGGGRSDLYLRSQQLPQSVVLQKTATFIGSSSNGGTWQFSIGRDDAPGLYEVQKIVRRDNTASSGYEVTSDIRGLDLTGEGVYIPDIVSAQEGVYSRYQAVTIQFLDTDTATAGLVDNISTADYDVTVLKMPLVKELQQYIGDRGVRDTAGDILIKAAIPCFLSLSFDLERSMSGSTVAVEDVQTALTAYVNSLGFVGKLYASALAEVVERVLPTGINVGAIDMFGRIRRPDGVQTYIRENDVLTIPEISSAYTSGRTVVFILQTANVAATLVNVSVPEV